MGVGEVFFNLLKVKCTIFPKLEILKEGSRSITIRKASQRKRVYLNRGAQTLHPPPLSTHLEFVMIRTVSLISK